MNPAKGSPYLFSPENPRVCPGMSSPNHKFGQTSVGPVYALARQSFRSKRLKAGNIVE